MFKSLSAGAAALALIAATSLVHAQDTTQKQTTVIDNPDGSQSVDKSKTERSTDDDGSQHVDHHDKSSTSDRSGNRNVTEKSSHTDRDSDGSVHHETETDSHHDN